MMNLLSPLTNFLSVVQPENTLQAILAACLEALKGGQWSLLVALVVMLLVWIAQKTPLVQKLVSNPAHRVWVAVGVSTLAAVVANFFTSGGNWLTAILGGLGTGLMSGGLWSALGKYLLPTTEKTG